MFSESLNWTLRSIKLLRTAEFKPLVVFVKPPPLERLRETRAQTSPTELRSSGRSFTEEDFQQMLREAQLMEAQYGHLFEKTIVNDDLSAAFTELRKLLDHIQTQSHWVPVSWTHS
uniref:Guanylate kinase-like domain-containing protein n=1 Tax=Knipowitschia caucasica TaxID=637954 RepID=A0AAV2LD95_KNICA